MPRTARRLIFASLVGVSLLAGLALTAGPAASQATEWWHSDYKTALAEAKQKDLPLLVVFR